MKRRVAEPSLSASRLGRAGDRMCTAREQNNPIERRHEQYHRMLLHRSRLHPIAPRLHRTKSIGPGTVSRPPTKLPTQHDRLSRSYHLTPAAVSFQEKHNVRSTTCSAQTSLHRSLAPRSAPIYHDRQMPSDPTLFALLSFERRPSRRFRVDRHIRNAAGVPRIAWVELTLELRDSIAAIAQILDVEEMIHIDMQNRVELYVDFSLANNR